MLILIFGKKIAEEAIKMKFDNYTDLINQAATNSQEISAEYDALWNNVLGLNINQPSLYSALCDLGEFFAITTLIFLIIKMYIDVQDGKTASFAQIILPLVAGLLLHNNGAQLASLTLEIRNLINNTNNQILTTVVNGQDLKETYQQAVVATSMWDEIGKQIRPCAALTGEAGVNCLEEAINQSQEYKTAVKNAFATEPVWYAAFDEALNELESDINNGSNYLEEGFPGFSVSSIVSKFLSPFLYPLWQSALFAILLAVTQGFQHALEIAMLLTALLGPLVVGGSLLPAGYPLPAFAWLTGFFSLAMAKVCFNIILGLIAVVINSQAATLDNIWFPTFLGIFAPILASALASGGGLAVWQSLLHGTERGVTVLNTVFNAIPF